MKEYVFTLCVENLSSALLHIASQFNNRGYIIESISSGACERQEASRVTIVSIGDEAIMIQILKQLNKCIDIIDSELFRASDCSTRELVVVTVYASVQQRQEIMQISQIFKAKINDIGPETITVEMSGTQQKVSSFIELLRPYGLQEITRTGKIITQKTATAVSHKHESMM